MAEENSSEILHKILLIVRLFVRTLTKLSDMGHIWTIYGYDMGHIHVWF